jgi:PmbA protein
LSACEAALTRAKNLHIDECEAIFVQKKIFTVRITDSEIAEIKQNQDRNLGMRVINQKKISSAQTNNPDKYSRIIEQALQSSKFLKPKKYWKSLPSGFKGSAEIKNLFDKKLEEISTSTASDIAQSMINAAGHPKISSISGSLNIVAENVEISNSNGLSCSEAGKYSIIFEPYSVGELLAFVFASNFSLKVYSDKRSCFSDKLGSKIAVENFSLIDDAHASEGVGSKLFDDEGVPTKQRPLIENGIFKNLYSDSFHAFKENQETSGNASRLGSPMGRSAQPIPIPAPHNLKVKGMEMKKDEIIKDTKRGLLVGRLWYTYAVNPIRGDFSCTARSGVRIIENGEIKHPGSSVRIVHNLPVMLNNISAIGNDTKNVLQWASLPSIAPTIRAEQIYAIPI